MYYHFGKKFSVYLLLSYSTFGYFNVINQIGRIDEENHKGQAAKDICDIQKRKLSEIENEKDMLTRKKKGLDNEKDKLEEDNSKLKGEVKKLQAELEKSSIDHVKAENQALGLKEELDFLKLVWELVHESFVIYLSFIIEFYNFDQTTRF